VTDVKFDKDKTILIVYAHGSHGKERSKENVLESGTKYPQLFINLKEQA